MARDPEERRERKRLTDRLSQKMRRARRAGLVLADPPLDAPRLTMNPDKAQVARDPDTGRTYPRNTEVFEKCLRLMKS